MSAFNASSSRSGGNPFARDARIDRGNGGSRRNGKSPWETSASSSSSFATEQQKVDQLQMLQQECVKSTERTMRALGEATDVGLATNDMLEIQGEQIDRIQTSLDKMHTDLDYADRLMKKLASPWGFSGRVKNYAKTFERIYGDRQTIRVPCSSVATLSRLSTESAFLRSSDRICTTLKMHCI